MEFNIEKFIPEDIIEVKVGAWRDTIVSGVVIGAGKEDGKDVIDYKLEDVATRCINRWCYLTQVISHKRIYADGSYADVNHKAPCEACGYVLVKGEWACPVCGTGVDAELA